MFFTKGEPSSRERVIASPPSTIPPSRRIFNTAHSSSSCLKSDTMFKSFRLFGYATLPNAFQRHPC